MGAKMPFMLKRNPVYEAIRKGKYFEIQYQGIFDETTRTICMTNMLSIFKATKGKNIIISSHSASLYTHRTPYDVASLMISLGMDKNMVLDCMKENAKNVVKSALHRTFFKGSIR
jgi:ribonuclease P/MRP protein subunit RPP1